MRFGRLGFNSLDEELERQGRKTAFLSLDFDTERPFLESQAIFLDRLGLKLGTKGGVAFVDEIQRFVDSEAQILFVPKSQIGVVAERERAIPFDAPGVELGHHNGLCTLDAIIKMYNLTDKALLRMARIVNAADTGRLEDDPTPAGLEAIAVGFSLRFPNDRENLQHQFVVYDALYAWCCLQVAKEAH